MVGGLNFRKIPKSEYHTSTEIWEYWTGNIFCIPLMAACLELAWQWLTVTSMCVFTEKEVVRFPIVLGLEAGYWGLSGHGTHVVILYWVRPIVLQGQFCLLWLSECLPHCWKRFSHDLMNPSRCQGLIWNFLLHVKQILCHQATIS